MQKFKSVEQLISQLKPEKPVYCIRKNSIQSAVKYFNKNFPGKILYAVKTNPNEKVIRQIILGGIYAGLLTPSESAAIAGLWALIMGFIVYRELTLDGLLKCLKETAAITAVIFAIIATATFLSVVLTYTQLPQKIIIYFTTKNRKLINIKVHFFVQSRNSFTHISNR